MLRIGWKERASPRRWISCQRRSSWIISQAMKRIWPILQRSTTTRPVAINISGCMETSALIPVRTLSIFPGPPSGGRTNVRRQARFGLAKRPDKPEPSTSRSWRRGVLGAAAGPGVVGGRFSPSRCLAVVDAPGDPVVISDRLAEIGLHEIVRLVAHVEASAEAVHSSSRGRRPDAIKFAGRQSLDERRLHLHRRNDELAVRLAVVGGELGQKLVVGNAGGSVEAGHLLDLGADRERDVAR